MSRQISFTRTPQLVADQSYLVTYSSVGSSMPSEIFVIKQAPLNPTQPGGTQLVAFDHISSPTELVELPTGAPLSGEFRYRAATFSINYQTASDADGDWAVLQADINGLISSLNANDDLQSPQTVTLAG